jgi:hypothetical protein
MEAPFFSGDIVLLSNFGVCYEFLGLCHEFLGFVMNKRLIVVVMVDFARICDGKAR